MAHRDGGSANLENHRPLGDEPLQRENQSASHGNNRGFLAVYQFLRTDMDASPLTPSCPLPIKKWRFRPTMCKISVGANGAKQ